MTSEKTLAGFEADADANACARRFDVAPYGLVLVFPQARRLYTVNDCAVSREEALRYIEEARRHG